jgi:hypothetical protein
MHSFNNLYYWNFVGLNNNFPDQFLCIKLCPSKNHFETITPFGWEYDLFWEKSL